MKSPPLTEAEKEELEVLRKTERAIFDMMMDFGDDRPAPSPQNEPVELGAEAVVLPSVVSRAITFSEGGCKEQRAGRLLFDRARDGRFDSKDVDAVAKVVDPGNKYAAKAFFDARGNPDWGDYAWVGVGKTAVALYQWVALPQPNLITEDELIARCSTVIELVDQTPREVLEMIQSLDLTHEQVILKRACMNDLVGRALRREGKVSHVVDHCGAGVKSVGQLEMDSVYSDSGDPPTRISVSAKRHPDLLSYSQIYNGNHFGTYRGAPEGYRSIRTLGLYQGETGEIFVVEFSPDLDVAKIKIVGVTRFRLMTCTMDSTADVARPVPGEASPDYDVDEDLARLRRNLCGDETPSFLTPLYVENIIRNLDAHLSRGGALPRAWAKALSSTATNGVTHVNGVSHAVLFETTEVSPDGHPR